MICSILSTVMRTIDKDDAYADAGRPRRANLYHELKAAVLALQLGGRLPRADAAGRSAAQGAAVRTSAEDVSLRPQSVWQQGWTTSASGSSRLSRKSTPTIVLENLFLSLQPNQPDNTPTGHQRMAQQSVPAARRRPLAPFRLHEVGGDEVHRDPDRIRRLLLPAEHARNDSTGHPSATFWPRTSTGPGGRRFRSGGSSGRRPTTRSSTSGTRSAMPWSNWSWPSRSATRRRSRSA